MSQVRLAPHRCFVHKAEAAWHHAQTILPEPALRPSVGDVGAECRCIVVFEESRKALRRRSENPRKTHKIPIGVRWIVRCKCPVALDLRTMAFPVCPQPWRTIEFRLFERIGVVDRNRTVMRIRTAAAGKHFDRAAAIAVIEKEDMPRLLHLHAVDALAFHRRAPPGRAWRFTDDHRAEPRPAGLIVPVRSAIESVGFVVGHQSDRYHTFVGQLCDKRRRFPSAGGLPPRSRTPINLASRRKPARSKRNDVTLATPICSAISS